MNADADMWSDLVLLDQSSVFFTKLPQTLFDSKMALIYLIYVAHLVLLDYTP